MLRDEQMLATGSARQRLPVLLLAAALAAAPAAATPAESTAELVADVNTTITGGTENILRETWFVELGGVALFNVDDGVHGNELWTSDGTPEGTHLLVDVCPGVCPAYPTDLVRVGDRVYFAADDGEHGRELWSTDGTAEGTVLAADVHPGFGESQPYVLAAWGDDRVVFMARHPELGREPYVSDGTAAGTLLLADVNPGPESSDSIAMAGLGDRFVFAASEPVHGNQLWVTDGTPEGTARLTEIYPGTDGGVYVLEPYPGAMRWAVLDGVLYFIVSGPSQELWRTDGTPEGTRRVNTELPGSGLDLLAGFTVLGERLYFIGTTGFSDRELWATDGTAEGTERVADVAPGPDGSMTFFLVAAGDRLFFPANDRVHGLELWVSDGTEEGTRLTADVFRDDVQEWTTLTSPVPFPGQRRVVVFGDDGVHGHEPWVSDGTAGGTFLLADLYPGPGRIFHPGGGPFGGDDRRAGAGGSVFFRAYQPDSGMELAVTDGTPGGTMAIEINDQTSAITGTYWGWLLPPRPIGAFGDGGALFSAGLPGVLGLAGTDVELWRTDGRGAERVTDLMPGEASSYPRGFAAVGDGAVFFGNVLEPNGLETPLWWTDGTPEGTLELSGSPYFDDLFCAERLADGRLYFSLGGLWVSDGTAAGTVPLPLSRDAADLGYLPISSCAVSPHGLVVGGGQPWVTDGTARGTRGLADAADPRHLVAAEGQVFFTAEEAATGRELWVSDGTPEGTAAAIDLLPGAGSGVDPVELDEYAGDRPLAPLGHRVVFAGDDGAGGEEPWVSDGTPEGTLPLGDLWPGGRGSEPRWLTAAAGRVYFVAGEPVHGRELWSTDGTPAGTRLEADLRSGPASSQPDGLLDLGTLLLFTADDGVHGREPFQLVFGDGELSLVADIAPGPLPSSPLSCARSAGTVYCAATDGATGFELWALRLSPLEIFADGFENGDASAWSVAEP